jgi:hypothetical protein
MGGIFTPSSQKQNIKTVESQKPADEAMEQATLAYLLMMYILRLPLNVP